MKVEGLARSLGVTKGILYWRDADRSAIVTAALELWERIPCESVGASVISTGA